MLPINPHKSPAATRPRWSCHFKLLKMIHWFLEYWIWRTGWLTRSCQIQRTAWARASHKIQCIRQIHHTMTLSTCHCCGFLLRIVKAWDPKIDSKRGHWIRWANRHDAGNNFDNNDHPTCAGSTLTSISSLEVFPCIGTPYSYPDSCFDGNMSAYVRPAWAIVLAF